MGNRTVEEWQVLSVFEVEPELLDSNPSIPWVYNESTYRIERNGIGLSFTIHPACGDVEMTLDHNGRLLYDFRVMLAQDVIYREDDGAETLQIVVSEHEDVLLRVKPYIELRHRIDDHRR